MASASKKKPYFCYWKYIKKKKAQNKEVAENVTVKCNVKNEKVVVKDCPPPIIKPGKNKPKKSGEPVQLTKEVDTQTESMRVFVKVDENKSVSKKKSNKTSQPDKEEPSQKNNQNLASKKPVIKSNKQIRKEKWLAKRDLLSKKKSELEVRWSTLCDAQRKLNREFSQARYAKLSPDIYDAVFTKTMKNFGGRPDFFRITAENFLAPMRALLDGEEAWEHIEMRKYDLKKIRLCAIPGDRKFKTHYQCSVPGLSKGTPSLIPCDSLVTFDGSQYNVMVIVDVFGDLLTFRPKKEKVTLQIADQKFDISFVPEGFNFDRYVNAIKSIQKDPRFREMLFGSDPLIDNRVHCKIERDVSKSRKLEERLSKCNRRQQQAVVNILEAKCRPHIYILFGPPGTGKTFTLVETIVQIYQRSKRFKILICSGSNTCVDAISKSIHETKQVDSLKRLSSIHYFKQLDQRPNYFSTEPNEVRSARVLVTTNTMASKLGDKDLYDYVMIDEAGHCHVPESLIPLTKLKKDGCAVLAGDPKQLGPVIKSFEVEQLGLGASLLEQLCKLDMYARDPEGQYNERYLTKLIESYRCDPGILGLCNKLFYQGDLKCLGKTPPSIMRIFGYSKPLVMAQVRGVEMSPRNSTSRLNQREAKACVDFVFRLYLMGLEPSQIGIITPYLLQKETLQNEFNQRLKKERRRLDDRFKLPPRSSRGKAKKTIEREISKQSHEKVSSDDLDDLDSLTRTLNEMRLQAEAIKESQEAAEIELINRVGPKADWQCQIDTVDAFQGSEREVIIVSTVRSPSNGKIEQCGFLADAQRFNVTISRAKWLVITVGHPAVLECCNFWKQYGQHSTRINIKNF